MPSVHSAVVTSLAVAALLVSGINSPVFGFAIVFAAIVMYDSFGVRRSAGEQAAAINMIVDSLDRGKVRLEKPDAHVREILGHQPKEVTAGAFLGLGLGALLNYQKLGAFGAYLQTVPVRKEMYVYFGVFLLILIAGVAYRLIMRAKYPKSKTVRRLTRRVLVMTETIGWLGLVSVAFVYEDATYLAWRLWPQLIIVLGLIWLVFLVWASYETVPEAIAEEVNEARKRKWLTFGQGKNKRKPKRAS
jgi:hypothetical protein